MTHPEQTGSEALALLSEMIEADIFKAAAAWYHENGLDHTSHQATKLGERAKDIFSRRKTVLIARV